MKTPSLSPLLAFLLGIVLLVGVATAEPFSATILAGRHPGTSNEDWGFYAEFLVPLIGQSFSIPPTSTSTNDSEIRWQWDNADSGEQSGAEVRTELQLYVDTFNTTQPPYPMTFRLIWQGDDIGVPFPTGVTATTEEFDSIAVNWIHESPAGLSFAVYRSTMASFPASEELANGITDLSFTDADVESGIVYYYWIVATREVDSATSEPSVPAAGNLYEAEFIEEIPQVVSLRVDSVARFSIDLKWEEIEGYGYLDGYEYIVQRDGEEIGRTFVVTFFDRNVEGGDLEEGRSYLYTVSLVRTSDENVGPPSKAVSGEIVGTGADGGLRIGAGDGLGDDVTVFFSNPEGVEGKAYEIWRSRSRSFSSATLLESMDVTYEPLNGEFLFAPAVTHDLTAEEGVLYHYWVLIRDFDGTIIMMSNSDPGYWGELRELTPGECSDLLEIDTPYIANQIAYIKSSVSGVDDYFGKAIAIDGDTMVVGAPREDSSTEGINGEQYDENVQNSGAGYVLRKNSNTGQWEYEAFIKPSNNRSTGASLRNGANFGHSVDISGDTIVVGCFGSNGGVGSAYVFVRNAGSWAEQDILTPSDIAQADEYVGFGTSVAIDGDTILVGAPFKDGARVSALSAYPLSEEQARHPYNSSGAAYLFNRNNGSWALGEILVGSNTTQYPVFGVGDPPPKNLNEFVVARYREINALWGCEQEWWAIEGGFGSPSYVHFGATVAISGDIAVVGAPGDAKPDIGIYPGDHMGCPHWGYSNSFGSATVFRKTGDGWVQDAYLKRPDRRFDTLFATSVAIDGESIVVGCPLDPDDGRGYGAAFVFVPDTTGNRWRQQAKLKSPYSGVTNAWGYAYWGLGSSVAVEGDRIAVTAPYMITPECDITGAAFLYERSGQNWQILATVSPEETDHGTNFNFGGRWGLGEVTIALQGDSLAVGTFNEDGGSSGINEMIDGSSLRDSGAVHFFQLEDQVWGYSKWAEENGLPTSPDFSNDDNNNNGTPDLLDYALGFSTDSQETPTSATASANLDGKTGITFVIPPRPRRDIQLAVQASRTMQTDSWEIVATRDGSETWSGANNVIILEDRQDDGSTKITVVTPWEIDETPSAFMRLSASFK